MESAPPILQHNWTRDQQNGKNEGENGWSEGIDKNGKDETGTETGMEIGTEVDGQAQHNTCDGVIAGSAQSDFRSEMVGKAIKS
ncbi:hypothetical protein WR25_03652 [Diploscapter pachys]|uniref:Uncharacterized protein n=1 Tax=Diploscapter pachys TaxID=2018661 RepID=A0A2A2KMY8_9BILA|nr:hypothetical protein WR25_03652 [Diploscapter pachys]